MTFWIVTGLMAVAIATLLALVLLKARSTGEPAAAYDLRVYKQQLRDIDKDLARGVINAEDAERTRTEISRRVLAADAQVRQAATGRSQPQSLSVAAVLITAVVLIAGSALLYLQLGAPGYGDLALETRLQAAKERAGNRPTQAEAEAHVPPRAAPNVSDDYVNLVAQLRKTAGERANDAQGQALLAQHEAALGNYAAAYQAKQNYITIMSGDIEARDHGEVAELMIMAAGGYVSPEAEEELRSALTLDRFHGPSRFYWGIMLSQSDRPDLAYQIWYETLQRGPAGAPWIEGIEAEIEDMAYRAGVKYTPITPGSGEAATTPGPSAEEVANAAELSAEDRSEMIQGMVSRLAERLATEGGPADEWARLINALAVLGDVDRARTIHTEAMQNFANDPAALALLDDAAKQAGLLP